MECNKCGWVMPFDKTFDNANCISCDGKIRYSADEYLEHPELGLVGESRNAQVDLTKLIVSGIKQEQQVVVEAGTGVGKSFAYLLPALLSGKRTVITTAKKTLQTQLIKKDLPYLEKKLNLSNPKGPLYARAYGKSNYACRKRVEHKSNKGLFKGALAEEFFKKAEHGVWEEAPEVLKKTPQKLLTVISRVFRELNAENCVGTECGHYNNCHYVDARKDVTTAQIIVSNHWLTGLDMMMTHKEKYLYFGGYDILIVDEAHKFEDGVRAAFTNEIKRSALNEVLNSMNDVYEYLPAKEKLHPNITIPRQKELVAAWNALFKKIGTRR